MPSFASDATVWFTQDRGLRALSHARGGMDHSDTDQFALGQSLFSKPWVEAPAATRARDGLGPLYNANSCSSCHQNLGGGKAVGPVTGIDRSLVIRLNADPVYGSQIAINAIHGVKFEAVVGADFEISTFAYADGSRVSLRRPYFRLENLNYGPLHPKTRLGPRRAPMLVGLGLVEQIPARQILELADPEDRNNDGISGKSNRVWSKQRDSWMLGRFGWKAGSSGIVDQTAKALIDDMGLTSPLYAAESCTDRQIQCRNSYVSENPDVPWQRLDAIGFFLRHLKAPKSNLPIGGAHLFEQIGCEACHRSGYRIGKLTVNPYSDYLLHDMGPALADGSQTADAGPAEWRTAPLWGLGLAKILNPNAGYLHDGRAATLEESILWHGGEAESARRAFAALARDQRRQLISFLKAL